MRWAAVTSLSFTAPTATSMEPAETTEPLSFTTQWAAVRTQREPTSVPPQNWPTAAFGWLLAIRAAIDGHSPAVAGVPPITLGR